MVDYVSYTFFAYFSVTDVFVAIFSASEFYHAVVEVYCFEVFESALAVEVVEGVVEDCRVSDVYAGCKGVLGVEADADVFCFRMIFDIGEFVPCCSEGCSFSCGVFQEECEVFVEEFCYFVDALGDFFESFFLSRADVCAGVEDEVGEF